MIRSSNNRVSNLNCQGEATMQRSTTGRVRVVRENGFYVKSAVHPGVNERGCLPGRGGLSGVHFCVRVGIFDDF